MQKVYAASYCITRNYCNLPLPVSAVGGVTRKIMFILSLTASACSIFDHAGTKKRCVQLRSHCLASITPPVGGVHSEYESMDFIMHLDSIVVQAEHVFTSLKGSSGDFLIENSLKLCRTSVVLINIIFKTLFERLYTV